MKIEAPPWSRFKNKEEIVEKLVLTPLIEAYRFVKEDITIATSENTITRKICTQLRKYSSISFYLEREFIDISCQSEEEGSEDGIIVKPDIKFHVALVIRVWIEAKRIYKDDSISEYCGNHGVGRFLSGYYSHQGNIDGMLAYIQKGKYSDIRETIRKCIKTCNCEKLVETVGLNSAFCSTHKSECRGNLKIYHLLFDFVLN